MVNQLVQRLTNLDFKHLINLKKKLKVYIYPNLQGLLLGLFVFFCFLISVFYENNSGLLISIVIFFIFFISIFVSHQNINNLRINFLTEYLVESNKKMFKGIANLGYRPTFSGKKILLEVNIFNFSKNIYFRKLKVDFIRFIRGERKFKNINALKKQIDKDILVSKKELK